MMSVSIETLTGKPEFYHLYLSDADPGLWHIRCNDRTVGLCVTYVDDVLFLAPTHIARAWSSKVSATWECSAPHVLSEQDMLKFVGIEIKQVWREGEVIGLLIAQEGYVKEMLAKHGMKDCNSTKSIMDAVECFDKKEEQELEGKEVDAQLAREAQGLTGELIWASTRTRPDISYSVQRMANLATRNPARSLRIGHKILRYLANDPGEGLFYASWEESERRKCELNSMRIKEY